MATKETTGPPANKPAKLSSVKNWGEWIAGWLPALGGSILSLIAIFRPREKYWLEYTLGFLSCVAMSVIVHELAHFFAAKWLGLKPWCLSIGHGSVVFEKQYRSFKLILRAFPYSGEVYPFLFADDSVGTRWKAFFMIAAGPLSNAVLLGVFGLVISGSSVSGLAESFGPTRFSVQMLLANGYLLLSCLIPFQFRIDGVRVPSDGLNMVRLLSGRSPGSWKQSLSAEDSTDRSSSGPTWNWAVNQIPPEVLLAQYRAVLGNSQLSANERRLALDGFVTCVLMYGADDFFAEADRYSEELFQANPTEWTVKGTRGSVLVEKGEIEAGQAMLQEVMEHDPSAFDRAIAASFLALAELKRNNRETALEWLRISRDLDPDCASMHRIESLVKATKAPASSGG
jgi:hypothetical protein